MRPNYPAMFETENHRQYSLHLPTEGWPGWVGLDVTDLYQHRHHPRHRWALWQVERTESVETVSATAWSFSSHPSGCSTDAWRGGWRGRPRHPAQTHDGLIMTSEEQIPPLPDQLSRYTELTHCVLVSIQYSKATHAQYISVSRRRSFGTTLQTVFWHTLSLALVTSAIPGSVQIRQTHNVPRSSLRSSQSNALTVPAHKLILHNGNVEYCNQNGSAMTTQWCNVPPIYNTAIIYITRKTVKRPHQKRLQSRPAEPWISAV